MLPGKNASGIESVGQGSNGVKRVAVKPFPKPNYAGPLALVERRDGILLSKDEVSVILGQVRQGEDHGTDK